MQITFMKTNLTLRALKLFAFNTIIVRSRKLLTA